MNPNDYRAAMDAIRFRAEFRQETVELLTEAARQHGKDATPMKTKRFSKILVIAAVLVLALAVTATAATLLLRPDEVAAALDDAALAAAFASPDAVLVNESAASGGYTFTLAGTVSGAGLSDFAGGLDGSRTYAVVSVEKNDGTPFDGAGFDFTVSPLLEGCSPRTVNLFTLNATGSAIVRNGTLYYLFNYDDLEIFADRTVYLAVYQGLLPPEDQFVLEADGAISIPDGADGPCALFTLPMDAAKADPAAAAAILEAAG